ncbi:hypothetical protein DFH07DRAFT_341922 [Mycena maculata]|uniref:Uncharacterized protein n=1 Tax=Mycena maculata TaxID=230809 RepID=A0AAD7HCD1_9AGAR|nr:hypothetical protein DFH07DRAFT_341922 [Mycena maculata]
MIDYYVPAFTKTCKQSSFIVKRPLISRNARRQALLNLYCSRARSHHHASKRWCVGRVRGRNMYAPRASLSTRAASAFRLSFLKTTQTSSRSLSWHTPYLTRHGWLPLSSSPCPPSWIKSPTLSLLAFGLAHRLSIERPATVLSEASLPKVPFLSRLTPDANPPHAEGSRVHVEDSLPPSPLPSSLLQRPQVTSRTVHGTRPVLPYAPRESEARLV